MTSGSVASFLLSQDVELFSSPGNVSLENKSLWMTNKEGRKYKFFTKKITLSVGKS